MPRKLIGERPKNPRLQVFVNHQMHEKMMIVAKSRGQECAEMFKEIFYPFIDREFQKLVEAGQVVDGGDK